ncbi:unnamed protein product [marine sediment metagenome]|uniref:Uncharacterized protein n=1 Tax=marine sediment metagenome TaxID=412755 RepID=X1V0C4_9ZZZZ
MADERKNAEKGEKKEERSEEEERKETKGDFETWFPPIEFLDTLNKERIAIPQISADKEAKVFQVLGKLLEKLPKKKLDWENISAADLLDLAPKLLREAPEEGIFIAATLLEKEPKWVRENLNFEMIFSLILPFVGREVKLFSKIGGLFENFGGPSLLAR